MGNRVSVAFTYDGKRYYVKGKTRAEANRKAMEKMAALKSGVIKASSMTMDAWWEKYISVYKTGLSARTLEVYDMIYRNAIRPHIGKLPLKEIKQMHCQRILNALDGKSKSYIHKTFILLNGSLEAAVDNDLILKNPMRGLKKPDGPQGKRRPLTEDERTVFLQAVEDLGDVGYYGKIVYFCGLRPSEAMRVRAEDFDRSNRLLSVRGAKTEASVRRVPVPDALPLPQKKRGLLFPNQNGEERDKNGQRNFWLRIEKAMCDISGEWPADDLTAYCLRHDFGTRCIEAGIDVETVSKMMGHSDVALTSRIYLHETDTTLKNAKQKMDSLYCGQFVDNPVESVEKSSIQH